MKKLLLLLLLGLYLANNTNAQNVGIGTNTPSAKLTVNGNLALLSDTVKISCGIMAPKIIIDNIAKPRSVFHIINEGCGALFVPPIIVGLSGGSDGKMVTIISHVDNMQIQHLQANTAIPSAADSLNMIELYEPNSNGAINQPYAYTFNNGGSITLTYDDRQKKWKPLSFYGDVKAETYGWYKGSNANDIYNPNAGNVGIGTGNPSRAKLVVGGGITSAILGNGGAGISFQKDWPTIGFNQYRDVVTGYGKAIANGYGMFMFFNQSQGTFGLSVQDSVAQDASFTVAPKRAITVFKNGNVHIGANDISDQAHLSIGGGSNYPSHFGYGTTGHTYIRGGNNISGNWGGNVIVASRVYINDLGSYDENHADAPGGDVIMVTGGGNVGIGTENTYGYKLAVNGFVRSKEIVVEAANWPDYVFDDKYQIKTLKDIEEFIKINKHLPGISSAQEIKNNGLKIGEVQNVMMEKIEELTLYVIELKKEIELLKSKK